MRPDPTHFGLNLPHLHHKGQPAQPQHHILGHALRGDEHKMLVDHPDPGANRIARGMKGDRLPVDADLPFVWMIKAREDVHQGRFAGPIFAQQRVDFARLRGKGDPIIGDHTGKPFGNGD